MLKRFTRLTHRFAPALLVTGMLAAATTAQARMVDTAHGEIDVPDAPVRVVTLADLALDTTLAAGVKPVGTLATRGGDGVADYLRAEAGKPNIVGLVREINLEAVLAAKPDLILASSSMKDQMYNTLSKIAPTIVPKADMFAPWQEGVLTYAEALGKEDQIKARLQQVDSRIDAISKRVPEGLKLSVVRWNPQGPIMMSSQLFVGQILDQLGIQVPESTRHLGKRPHSDTLSLENLGKVDADYLFLATLNAEGQQALDTARQQTAFQRLGAVEAGHVTAVDGQYWSSSAGIIAAEKVLDDIEANWPLQEK